MCRVDAAAAGVATAELTCATVDRPARGAGSTRSELSSVVLVLVLVLIFIVWFRCLATC